MMWEGGEANGAYISPGRRGGEVYAGKSIGVACTFTSSKLQKNRDNRLTTSLGSVWFVGEQWCPGARRSFGHFMLNTKWEAFLIMLAFVNTVTVRDWACLRNLYQYERTCSLMQDSSFLTASRLGEKQTGVVKRVPEHNHLTVDRYLVLTFEGFRVRF